MISFMQTDDNNLCYGSARRRTFSRLFSMLDYKQQKVETHKSHAFINLNLLVWRIQHLLWNGNERTYNVFYDDLNNSTILLIAGKYLNE
jgi:hypothetical protein